MSRQISTDLSVYIHVTQVNNHIAGNRGKLVTKPHPGFVQFWQLYRASMLHPITNGVSAAVGDAQHDLVDCALFLATLNLE